MNHLSIAKDATPPELPALERMIDRLDGISSAISGIEGIADRACGSDVSAAECKATIVPNGMIARVELLMSDLHTRLLEVRDRLGRVA